MADDELDMEPTEEAGEDEALPAPKYEIFSYPSDTPLKGYLEQWNKQQLFIPEFQRGYVWDQTRASKLIESFLLGLPVPPTFLYKPADAKSFWIIDGQQRIRSLVDFQKGFFGEIKFRLKGVDTRWNGKTFEDLSEEDKFNLETTVLRSIVIQQTHPADHSSIYQIFERLNTGGVRLNPMEVRQCVYSSEFLAKIKKLNENQDWRRIIGLQKADNRLKDRELILRIVSLYRDVEHYEKPMKRFLNKTAIDFQENLKNNTAVAIQEVDDIENRFARACQEIVGALGERPFHLKGRLNFGALDAVMANIIRYGPVDELNDKYKKLLADETFQSDVSYNTSDDNVLKRRFETAARFLG
jgi:hypothetical protein